MQRYFVAPKQFSEGMVQIEGDDFYHLAKVMRAKVGEQVIVCDGVGREVLAEIGELAVDSARLAIVEERNVLTEPGIDIWIAQSLPKGDKMETVVQKGTEIGASRFIPFISERTIVHYDAKKEKRRLERWRKIAKEAAEQAHRGRVPTVEEPCQWKQLMDLFKETDAAWICYEKEQSRPLKQVLRELSEHAGSGTERLKVMLVIGPEGGFTAEEVVRAEAAGMRTVSLGSRILRTETAAMVGLSCILYEFGEMGG